MRLNEAIRYSLLALAAGALAVPVRAMAADAAVAAFVDRINAARSSRATAKRSALPAPCW